ncbi:hypothetical protein C8R43DRAFT_659990 [Mycena crocata]|nr:hypothetical protein C8R43DRAFT_659990 [Mycena crocata]
MSRLACWYLHATQSLSGHSRLSLSLCPTLNSHGPCASDLALSVAPGTKSRSLTDKSECFERTPSPQDSTRNLRRALWSTNSLRAFEEHGGRNVNSVYTTHTIILTITYTSAAYRAFHCVEYSRPWDVASEIAHWHNLRLTQVRLKSDSTPGCNGQVH